MPAKYLEQKILLNYNIFLFFLLSHEIMHHVIIAYSTIILFIIIKVCIFL